MAERLGKHKLPMAQKKGKSFYSGKKKAKFSRSGGPAELCAGMQGVLITTGDQEKLCVSEAYNLLNEYADQLYGPEFADSANQAEGSTSSPPPLSIEGGTEDDDIAAALAKEVQCLKGTVKKERRFKAVNSGAKHVVFVVCAPPVDPCELVHYMLADVIDSGEKKSRYCQRMLPVVKVCHASAEDISKNAVSVLEPHFHTDDVHIVKFAVSYKARNNNVIKRDDVIKLIADMVNRDGDFEHVVDLNNPDLTVVVEIIKNLCCLSVVKDFHKLSKYNIHMLTEPKKPNTVSQQPAPKETVTIEQSSSEKSNPTPSAVTGDQVNGGLNSIDPSLSDIDDSRPTGEAGCEESGSRDQRNSDGGCQTNLTGESAVDQ